MLDNAMRQDLVSLGESLVIAGRPAEADALAKIMARADSIPSPPTSSPFTPGDNGLPPNMMAAVMPWHLLIPEGFELVIRRSSAGA
jgi:hypothetical protein